MEKIRGSWRIVAGFIAATFIFVLGGLRMMAELIGYTTTPDDADALRKKAPAILEWFLGLPWWIAAAVVVGGAAMSAWLVISGTKSLVGQQRLTVEMPKGYMTAEQADEIMTWFRWFKNDYGTSKPLIEGSIRRLPEEVGKVTIATIAIELQNISDMIARTDGSIVALRNTDIAEIARRTPTAEHLQSIQSFIIEQNMMRAEKTDAALNSIQLGVIGLQKLVSMIQFRLGVESEDSL